MNLKAILGTDPTFDTFDVETQSVKPLATR